MPYYDPPQNPSHAMGDASLDLHEKHDELWHETAPSTYVPGSPEEKALVRKIDMRIVVSVCICLPC